MRHRLQRTRDARLAAVSAGDEQAIAELVRELWPSLWRAARAVSCSAEDAEDAVQEALRRGIERANGFSSTSEIFAWMRRVAINCAIDARRSESARNTRERVAAATGAGGGDDPADGRTARDPELMAACMRLTPGTRHVLLLHFWADMDLRDIGEALQLPVGTVKSRLSRGLAKLRDDLEGSTP